MEFVRQTKLLIWKNFLLRRKQPILFALEIFWPVIALSGTIFIRLSNEYDVQEKPCFYSARTMPSTDLASFFKSFLCNLENECVSQNETQDDILANTMAQAGTGNQEDDIGLEHVKRGFYRIAEFASELQNLHRTGSPAVQSDLSKSYSLVDYLLNYAQHPKLTAYAERKISNSTDMINHLCQGNFNVSTWTPILYQFNTDLDLSNAVRLRKSICILLTNFSTSTFLKVLSGSFKHLIDANKEDFAKKFKEFNVLHTGPEEPDYTATRLNWSDHLIGLNLTMPRINQKENEFISGIVKSSMQRLKNANQKANRDRRDNNSLDYASSAEIAIQDSLMELKQIINTLYGDRFATNDLSPPSHGKDYKNDQDTATGIVWQAFSKFACNKVIRMDALSLLDQISDSSFVNEQDLQNLPTKFCKALYVDLIKNYGGTLIWKYLKPLLTGKILVAPHTNTTLRIIMEANNTFKILEKVFTLTKLGAVWSNEVIKGYTAENVAFAEKIIRHPVVSNFLWQFAQTRSSELIDSVRGASKMSSKVLLTLNKILRLISNVTDCINLDRFLFFENDSALEIEANRLIADDRYFGGVVFDSMLQEDAPAATTKGLILTTMRYSVRMQSDKVPRPYNITEKFDFAGISSRFDSFTNSYLYGFLFIQDAIDSAIISLARKSSADKDHPDVKVQIKPFPKSYTDQFSQHLELWLPLFLVFSWLFCVGLNVKTLIHDSELGLSQIMISMGLNRAAQWTAWFLCSSLIFIPSSLMLVFLLKIGQITKLANPLLIWFLLIDFQLSVLMFCYLISSLFKKAALATVISVILYMLAYLPYILSAGVSKGASKSVHKWAKISGCLSSPTSFAFACLQLASFEKKGYGIQWNNINGPLEADKEYYEIINYCQACLFIFFDAMLYFSLGLIVSLILPKYGENRLKLICLKFLHYWRDPKSMHLADENCREDSSNVEGVVDVKKLSKYCGKNKFFRLRDLSLVLYKNTVTVLVGPNGSGKTTFMSILTGILSPSSGFVTVCGKTLHRDRMTGNKLIGYCPQFNILFDQLTVMEHMLLYGRLRDLIQGRDLLRDIQRVLGETDLLQFADRPVRALSGGAKRRLCLSIALVGGSKFIILDEPTAGIDPLAKRQIWEILKRCKGDRTILLSTHLTEDAEELADVLAIIRRGTVICTSTVSEIKKAFGNGLRLNITLFHGDTAELSQKRIKKLIYRYFPDPREVCQIGRTLVAVLAPRSSHRMHVNPSCLIELLKCLDMLKSSGKIESFEMQAGSLEDAVIRAYEAGFGKAVKKVSNGKFYSKNCESLFFEQTEVMNSKVFPKELQSDETGRCDLDPVLQLTVNCCQHSMLEGIKLRWSQTMALLHKRLIRTKRDKRLICTATLMPCLFVALAMACSIISPTFDSTSSIELSPKTFGSESVFFVK